MPKTTITPEVTGDVSSLAATPASYEAAMAELDALVTSMESGALPLEESLAAYKRGAELVRYCQQVLERVEQQVKVLDGEVLKPLTESDARTDNE